MAVESAMWYLFLSSLLLFKWIIHHLHYCFRKLDSYSVRQHDKNVLPEFEKQVGPISAILSGSFPEHRLVINQA